MFYMPVTIKMVDGLEAIENIGHDTLVVCSKRMQLSSDFFKGKNVLVYDDYFQDEPDLKGLNLALAKVRSQKPQQILGIGGGSVLDLAKILSVKTALNAREIFTQKVIDDRLPLILVPTTAGTGSEVTPISIMADVENATKMGISHPLLYADQAYLIPSLLEGMPRKVMMASAIDAWIHAFESYFSKHSNPLTEYQSLEALRLMTGVLDTCRHTQTPNKDTLLDMLMASTIAGIAFANAGTGAVHAMSYPLGGKYHVAHGEANSQCLMPVVEAYLKVDAPKVETFTQLMEGILKTDQVSVALKTLFSDCLPLCSLRDYGVSRDDLDDFVEIVLTKQERLTKNNYVDFDRDDYLSMYLSRY